MTVLFTHIAFILHPTTDCLCTTGKSVVVKGNGNDGNGVVAVMIYRAKIIMRREKKLSRKQTKMNQIEDQTTKVEKI